MYIYIHTYIYTYVYIYIYIYVSLNKKIQLQQKGVAPNVADVSARGLATGGNINNNSY